MRLRLTIAACLLPILPAHARDFAVTGDTAAVVIPSPACQDMASAKDAEAIRQQGDQQALAAFLLPRAQAGLCRLLVKGARVYVMQSAVWQGMARVRPEGAPESYWVIDTALERVK